MNDSSSTNVNQNAASVASSNSTTTSTTSATTPPVCCEFFIERLNKQVSSIVVVSSIKNTDNNDDDDDDNDDGQSKCELNDEEDDDEDTRNKSVKANKPRQQEYVINTSLTQLDVVSFLNYCHIFQLKQCLCIFTNDDLIERFHHFLHNIIATSVLVIKHLPSDYNSSVIMNLMSSNGNGNEAIIDQIKEEDFVDARSWSMDDKEKLFLALLKIFSPNMPLYMTYRHLLFNHGKYNRIKDCSCSKLNYEPVPLIQMYCQTSNFQRGSSANSSHQEFDMSIELLRNICHFVDLGGLDALKFCFAQATPDNLPINVAHSFFNLVANIKIWLNPATIESKLHSMRKLVIKYMCQLSDKDLRQAGTKNTTELMYESFKDMSNNIYLNAAVSSKSNLNTSNTLNILQETSANSKSNISQHHQQQANRRYLFRLDCEGLDLAYKYFMCSTLTIRLSGIAQMNMQINAWGECNQSLNSLEIANDGKNELADWFVKNKIIEHLYGPNLHVEVIKRSQDIVNFLAFTNRLNERHLDVMWASAQLKHCSKPVMETLMSLHKHLSIGSTKYLSSLISKLDISQHNEQTLLLSAFLSKNLWYLMLDQIASSNETNLTKLINRNEKLISTKRFKKLSSALIVNKSKKRLQQNITARMKKKQIVKAKTSSSPTKANIREASKFLMKNEMKMIRKMKIRRDKERKNTTLSDSIRNRLQPKLKKPMQKRNRDNLSQSSENNEDNQQHRQDKTDNLISQCNNNSNDRLKIYNKNEDSSCKDEDMNENNESSKNVKIPQKIFKRHTQSMDTQPDNRKDMQSNSKSHAKKYTQLYRGENGGDDDDDEVLDDDDDVSDEDNEIEECDSDEDDDDDDDDEDEDDDDDDDDDEDDEENENNHDDIYGYQANTSFNNVNEIDEHGATTRDNDDSNGFGQTDDEEEGDEENEDDDSDDESEEENNVDIDQEDDEEDDDDEEDEEDDEDDNRQVEYSDNHDDEVVDEEVKQLLNKQNKKLASQNNFNQKVSETSSYRQQKEIDKMLVDNVNSNSNNEQLSHSSGVSSPSSAKNMNDLEIDGEEDEEILKTKFMSLNKVVEKNAKDNINFDEICAPGHTLLWDILIEYSIAEENSVTKTKNNSSDINNTQSTNQKVFKEAEKQLQTLLCLSSTDKRIRLKFIESCLLNIKNNRACIISFRLLIKLFNSFQQYASSSSSTNPLSFIINTHSTNSFLSPIQQQLLLSNFTSLSIPTNIIEIYKIVAHTECKHLMIEEFFQNLKVFTSEQHGKLKQLYEIDDEDERKVLKSQLVNQIRLNVQSRLAFLSFIYSNLGSPRDFSLSREHAELLWNSLTSFEDTTTIVSQQHGETATTSSRNIVISIRDDLFNWFLNQAKSKDQHAISIDTFKFIFLNKMHLLDPMSFSQNALHLYQELFKIYKISYQQKINDLNEDDSNEAEMASLLLTDFKQMEETAIDYIAKLAFKSANNDVSLAAIQFLNAHYIQSDVISSVEHENQFINCCMSYLNEACDLLEKQNSTKLPQTFDLINRGMLLLKNHLDLFQRRHSYQIQLMRLNGQHDQVLSHFKLLQQQLCKNFNTDTCNSSTNQTINFLCHVNPTNFKFILNISTNECIGDLRAIVREILLKIVKAKSSISDEMEEIDKMSGSDDLNLSKIIKFSSIDLSKESDELFCASFDQLIHLNPNTDIMPLIHKIASHQDEFYIRIYANGQEITSQQQQHQAAASMLLDSKLIGDLGFKNMQLLNISLYSGNRAQIVPIDKNCLPMLILSKEIHFKSLFRLLNQISKLSDNQNLAFKLWDVILTLPTNMFYYESIRSKPERYLIKLIDQFLIKNDELVKVDTNNNSPYQLLYYLQIIEIVFKQNQQQEETQLSLTESQMWSKHLYKLLLILVRNLVEISESNVNESESTSNSNDIVLLESILIILRLICNCLYITSSSKASIQHQNPNKHDLIDKMNSSDQTGDELNETPRKKPKKQDTAFLNLIKSSDSSIDSPSRISNGIFGQHYNPPAINSNILKELLMIDNTLDSIETFINLLFNIQILASNSSNTNCDFEFFNDIKNELLFHSMQLLSSCLVSKNLSDIRKLLVDVKLKETRLFWFKSLLLVDDVNKSNFSFRKEACAWIYRMCTLEKQASCFVTECVHSLLESFLGELLCLLHLAVKYEPNIRKSTANKLKIYCKDYFALITNLIDHLDSRNIDMFASNEANLTTKGINMNRLVLLIRDQLRERDYFESINATSSNTSKTINCVNYHEDDALIGLLNLAIVIVKQEQKLACIDNTRQTHYFSLVNRPSHDFLDELFSYLMKLNNTNNPSSKQQRIKLPKCRSGLSRSLCFELIVELCRCNIDNYSYVFEKLNDTNNMVITNPTTTSPESNQLTLPSLTSNYSWDYWPRDDMRSPCGYVGLVNLGATCYMATSMQHLFMIEEARNCILKSKVSLNDSPETVVDAKTNNTKNDKMLIELKRIFANLQESERKAFSPKEFCKVYTMDNQPLNTTEQKDMQEFFTDLISKLEETSNIELKHLLKSLFGGTITNLVISLDCPHVSCTLEEFYTVRCQVAGMKDLYDSLNEITVKDTLEGDNMYTCSKCSRKVRAEKRACFRQLPQILCFNTMRYTFNMITMLKEKVNTHFSFPLRLDMSGYMEKNLIKKTSNSEECGSMSEEQLSTPKSQEKLENDLIEDDNYIYDLIGVTVHTGTADGGHYYSFIRERQKSLEAEDLIEDEEQEADDKEVSSYKWYLFNDSEVKPFDAKTQLASECFGGETTSKTYDSTSDKFMDLSFEKTNSAYMLFYEKKSKKTNKVTNHVNGAESAGYEENELFNLIMNDNLKFLNDRNIFEHGYFNFMWQMCDYVPRGSLVATKRNESQLYAVKLGSKFLFDTYIHSRDKSNVSVWLELLMKMYGECKSACTWFISFLINENSMQWCFKCLLKCPNMSIRQTFHRLLIHIIKICLDDPSNYELVEEFIAKYLDLVQIKKANANDNQSNHTKTYILRYMNEYFAFLYDFARNGQKEQLILIKAECISKLCKFYLFNRRQNSSNSQSSTKQSSKSSKKPSKTSTSANSPKKIGNIKSSSSSSISSETSNLSTMSSRLSSSSSSLSSSSSTSSSMHSLLSADDPDDQNDIVPLHDQKSKLKVFDRLLSLLSFLIEKNSVYIHEQHHANIIIGKKKNYLYPKLKLNFFYKATLDDINFNHVRGILISYIRINNCIYSHHPNETKATKKSDHTSLISKKFVDMCCNSIKKLQQSSSKSQGGNNSNDNKDRCMSFLNILGNGSIGLFESTCLYGIESKNNEEVKRDAECSMDESCSKCMDCQSVKIDFTDLILNKLEFLFEWAPCHSLQWLINICNGVGTTPITSSELNIANTKKLQTWLLENMNLWVKKLLIQSKFTNVRYAAACLLASLVPNRTFRETYHSNRSLFSPFKPSHSSNSANSSSSSLNNNNLNDDPTNLEFDSAECKNVLHKIIKYLFSLFDELTRLITKEAASEQDGKLNISPNRLVQYFCFLIYCMSSKDEKLLLLSHQKSLDKFWSSFFYPHVANNHVCTNLNKQMAVHFLYQSFLNCDEIVEYILKYSVAHGEALDAGSSSQNTPSSSSSSSMSSRRMVNFTNRIARELPLCTVAVDHEDTNLIAYNRQCLHVYYAMIRILCKRSTHYLKEMYTNSNFQWAFKHVLPYSGLYPSASLELNKCLPLFLKQKTQDDENENKNVQEVNDEDEDEELIGLIANFKENLVSNLFNNSDIEIKQSWSSIITIMRLLSNSIDDISLVMSQRGLSVLTICFFHIVFLQQANYSFGNTQENKDQQNFNQELCDLMEIFIKLGEVIKHHMNRQNDVIKQIMTLWKEKNEFTKRVLMLINFYNPNEVRYKALELLKIMISISASNEQAQLIIHLIHNAYFTTSASNLYLSYSTSNCNNINAKSPSTSSTSSSGQQQQCQNSSQLIPQAIQLMGPYFPLSKKLNVNQVALNISKQPKLVFNMFMPLMLVAHIHLNGAILLPTLTNNIEYEKLLVESYAPFLSFFECICKLTFSKRFFSQTGVLESSSTSTISIAKELIDLILLISQQSLLINTNFLPYIINYLKVNTQEEATSNSAASTSNEAAASSSNDSLNDTEEFFELVAESPYLNVFISSVMNDFRYMLNRKEIFDFVEYFLERYLFKIKYPISHDADSSLPKSSTLSSAQQKRGKDPISNSQSTERFKIIRSLIERSFHSISEARFFFEFQQVSKYLETCLVKIATNQSLCESNQLSTAACSSTSSSTQENSMPQPPNITNNIEWKTSQLIGSLKAIQLLLKSTVHIAQATTNSGQTSNTAASTPTLLSENDSCEYLKLKIDLRTSLVEITDYLKTQLFEMKNFIENHLPADDQTPLEKTKTPEKSEEDIEMNDNDELTTKIDSKQSSGKTQPKHKQKPLDNEATKSIKSKSQRDENAGDEINPVLFSILKQVELKSKYLESVLQVTISTINLVTSIVSVEYATIEDTSTTSSSTSSTSNNNSSTSSDSSSSSSSNTSDTSSASSTSSSPTSNENSPIPQSDTAAAAMAINKSKSKLAKK